jgi:hypothetical protein
MVVVESANIHSLHLAVHFSNVYYVLVPSSVIVLIVLSINCKNTSFIASKMASFHCVVWLLNCYGTIAAENVAVTVTIFVTVIDTIVVVAAVVLVAFVVVPGISCKSIDNGCSCRSADASWCLCLQLSTSLQKVLRVILVQLVQTFI